MCMSIESSYRRNRACRSGSTRWSRQRCTVGNIRLLPRSYPGNRTLVAADIRRDRRSRRLDCKAQLGIDARRTVRIHLLTAIIAESFNDHDIHSNRRRIGNTIIHACLIRTHARCGRGSVTSLTRNGFQNHISQHGIKPCGSRVEGLH
jgi:hypothetical protein